ncbi:hypothetical protein ElyMa_006537100 [Elysia marginata]|uniref:Secreted protein n=1 Tax=Elysia marginata TaxID=1093978 RepID=A0AAV4I6W0_9GAST|nr:hypothetical protein ElyMa_006537100 [Elysia marginata]
MCTALLPFFVHVLLSIVEGEGPVNGGALFHELDAAAGVSGDVADREQAVGQVGAPGGGGEPGGVRGLQQRLRFRNGDESRGPDCPVNTIDDAGSVGCNLAGFNKQENERF